MEDYLSLWNLYGCRCSMNYGFNINTILHIRVELIGVGHAFWRLEPNILRYDFKNEIIFCHE